ncbi:MAG: hypothetical protein WB613_06805 [Pseudolabrys sp.]
MNISQAVLLWKRKGVKGGKAAAQQSRPLMKQSQAFEVILTHFDVRYWHFADISYCAAHVRYWGKADMTYCGANVCF